MRTMIMRGTSNADTISGLQGNDDLQGRAGTDESYGGRGYDYLRGQSGNDELTGDEGVDTYMGRKGNDTLYAHDGYRHYVFCGLGVDRVPADENDEIDPDCEIVDVQKTKQL